MALIQPEPGRLYKHFKGKIYEVLFVGLHTETFEELVVYRAMGEDQIWVRPLKMWIQTVEVEGKIIPRFSLIEY